VSTTAPTILSAVHIFISQSTSFLYGQVYTKVNYSTAVYVQSKPLFCHICICVEYLLSHFILTVCLCMTPQRMDKLSSSLNMYQTKMCFEQKLQEN
jgi:hypothetical protein